MMSYGGRLYQTAWPEYDEAKTVEATVEIAVQINGKTKITMSIDKDMPKDDVISAAKEALGDKLSGNVVKEIYVPNKIVNFVVKLSDRQGLGEKDHLFLATTYRTVRDLERIGDYAENIMEYAEILKEENKVFSDDALYEIKGLRQLIANLYKRVIEAYNKEDKECLALACEIEENIDDYTKMMEDNHIERLTKGICTPSVGAQYLSLSSNVERIADHLINVGNSITRWD